MRQYLREMTALQKFAWLLWAALGVSSAALLIEQARTGGFARGGVVMALLLTPLWVVVALSLAYMMRGRR